MSRVRAVVSVRCLVLAAAGASLSGCLVTVPTSGGTTALSPRRLASEMPAALPPPSSTETAASAATLPEYPRPETGLATHAAVVSQIGAPPSPRAAMGGGAGVGAIAVAPQAVAATREPAPGGQAGAVAQPQRAAAAMPVVADAPDAQMWAGIRAGQCWAQLVKEPVTRRQTVQVVTEDGATRLLVQPPELRTQSRQVVVKDEAQTYRVEPPRFRQVTEQVKVKDEVRRLVVVPARYENREETVQVESARVVLESCRASAQRAAGSGVASRQAKCAREIPAQFQTITRRVLVQPETTREEVTPAVYSTITKWVLEAPARAVPETLPASTRDVPLTEVARPASVQEREVEATTAALRVTQHEGMPQLVWRRALCEGDAMPDVVSTIQQALRKQGLDVGSADGKLGRRTMAALMDYQRREGLAIGLVTFETLDKLGLPKPQP